MDAARAAIREAFTLLDQQAAEGQALREERDQIVQERDMAAEELRGSRLLRIKMQDRAEAAEAALAQLQEENTHLKAEADDDAAAWKALHDKYTALHAVQARLRNALIGLQTIPAEDTTDPADRCWCGAQGAGASEHADYCVNAAQALTGDEKEASAYTSACEVPGMWGTHLSSSDVGKLHAALATPAPSEGGAVRLDAEFLRWARQAIRGLDHSNVMIGVLGDEQSGARYEFALQIGHCLLEGKPLILIAPKGATVPPKLEAAATVLEYFDAAIPESAELATARALARVGVVKKH